MLVRSDYCLFHIMCSHVKLAAVAVDAGLGSRAELSSPVVQQGKVGNMVMVVEEQI